MEFHSSLEQWLAIPGISRVHGRDIRGGERVGDDLDGDSTLPQAGNPVDACFPGYEVGRDEQEFLFRALHNPSKLRCQMHGGVVWTGRNFLRMIRHHHRPAVEKRDRLPGSRGQCTCPHRLRVGRLLHQLLMGQQFLQAPLYLFCGDHLPAHLTDRYRCPAVPVKVERIDHLPDHWSPGHRIEVGEVHAVGRAEVFIPDIASANDGDQAIHCDRLVMHAPVDAFEVQQRAQEPCRPSRGRLG